MGKLKSQLEDLSKALQRLKEAAGLENIPIHQDASIQRFELTFELAWKVLREIEKQEGLQVVSPRDAIRKAADIGLIENPEEWFTFLEARYLSVHTYKEEIAQKVYLKAIEFIPNVEKLFENMGKKELSM